MEIAKTNNQTPKQKFLDFSKARVGRTLSFVKYDSATLNDINREMFLNCDYRSADASNDALTRARIREFARKEVANNSYARGLTLLVSSDMIGRGPRLQIEDDLGCNEIIERSFNSWANEVQLSEKLKTGKIAKMVDGETFFVFYRDRKLKSLSKLNVRLLESDQIATPPKQLSFEQEVDGIDLDDNGDPIRYYVLKQHPGSSYHKHLIDYTAVSVDSICHWYRIDRPCQHRGVSEFAPALPLFYQLRRYTMATVEAAEIAANFPMVLYTDSPAITEIQSNTDEFCSFPLEPGKITALPEAWKLGQVHAEQPVTTYSMFKREIVTEVARVFQVPANIALGDSSGYNYASGRLDNQAYHKSIDVERKLCETQVLQKIFERWFEETYFRNSSPRQWIAKEVPSVSWFWDGFPHSDPTKEASAQETRLNNFTTSLSRECARQGIDWVTHLHQIARERELMNQLGLLQAQPQTVERVEENEEED